MFSSGSKPDIILEWSEVFNTAPRIRVRVRVRARVRLRECCEGCLVVGRGTELGGMESGADRIRV